ncbi:MAG: DsbA family protein [Anaerolineae bacterium]|nr:DsbA family protein [Anaerolineae bacterium]
MESPQPTSQPETVQELPSPSPVVDQPTQPAIEPDRSTLYFIVTAIAFFVIGYGVAWFSFNTALTAQNDLLDTTVRQAVSEALSNIDLNAVAGDESAQEPAILEVSVDDDPAIGPEDAPIVVVEFSDYRCPYCARFHEQTLYPLLEQYEGQIRLVYRDFPVVGGEQAALASECADDQGMFWEYHDLLFENQQSLSSESALVELASQLDLDIDEFTTCLTDSVHEPEIEGDFADAVSYGLRGTPSFFINGRLLVGAQPLSAFTAVIDDLLAELPVG